MRRRPGHAVTKVLPWGRTAVHDSRVPAPDRRNADDLIPVHIAMRRASAIARPPAMPWLFAAAMAASTAIAAFGGLVLGYLAATESGFGSRHWTEAVQAHGHLQLAGWATVFVAALTFEFVVRLNQRPALLPAWPRAGVLLALSLGAILEAVGQVWHGRLGFAWPLGAGVVLAGTAGFALIVFRVPAPRPLREDFHSLWFRTAAGWLVAATALQFLTAARASLSIAPLDDSRLTTELVMRGFVLSSVVAVGLRAFPGHLGLTPVGSGRQRAAWSGLTASVVAWAAGSGAYGLPDSEVLRVAGDLLFAATVLLLTGWLQVLRPLREPRGGPRYRVLVPVAWLALCAYALALAAAAVFELFGDRSLYEAGAVRHIFLLGFMAPLMVAMAHIVLARFGTGHVLSENWLTAAFVLLMVAWPLRVLPVLLSDSPGAGARHVLGAAGAVAFVALALFALVAARNALAIFRRSRVR
jgi:uncharacterized protein involved in response to NO